MIYLTSFCIAKSLKILLWWQTTILTYNHTWKFWGESSKMLPLIPSCKSIRTLTQSTIRYFDQSVSCGMLDQQPRIILKLEITKAFDSVSWPFLVEVLQSLGFGPVWRVMKYEYDKKFQTTFFSLCDDDKKNLLMKLQKLIGLYQFAYPLEKKPAKKKCPPS